MRLADAEIYKHLVWGVYVPWKDKKAMPGLERADIILGELQRLAGESWMAGDQFSLADAYVYPMLTYFSIAPEGAVKLAQFTRLAVWMEQMRDPERRYFFAVFRGKTRCWFTLIRLVHCFFIISPYINKHRRRDRMYVLRFGKRF